MLSNADAIQLKAKFFRGFADPTRLAVLETLLDGEKNVNEIVEELGISQPNASGHLACLRDCGLVKSEPRGKFTYYRLYDDKIRDLLGTAEGILLQVADGIYACTRYAEPEQAAHRVPRASNVSHRERAGTGRSRA
ncbi:MAG TPA: metalloregulator ArsR/SmtB family transcription factor [Chloroflexota bacterium]